MDQGDKQGVGMLWRIEMVKEEYAQQEREREDIE
jgi:hypothetical protein